MHAVGCNSLCELLPATATSLLIIVETASLRVRCPHPAGQAPRQVARAVGDHHRTGCQHGATGSRNVIASLRANRIVTFGPREAQRHSSAFRIHRTAHSSTAAQQPLPSLTYHRIIQPWDVADNTARKRKDGGSAWLTTREGPFRLRSYPSPGLLSLWPSSVACTVGCPLPSPRPPDHRQWNV